MLAFETSGLCGSVAIAQDKEIREASMGEVLCHARDLLVLAECLLRECGLTVKDIASVAVGVGPGSYTGMRVGIAAAKALAWARGMPLVGVSSLATLARNAPTEASFVVPVIDAKRGAVYYALYERQAGELVERISASVGEASDLRETLPAGAMLVGSGSPIVAQALPGQGFAVADEAAWLPDAGKLAALALDKLARGDTTSPFNVTPCYLRRSEAEELWEKKRRLDSCERVE